MHTTFFLNCHVHKQPSESSTGARLATIALASFLALPLPSLAGPQPLSNTGKQDDQQKNGLIYFDIEAQPLQDALESFNARTGFAGLYSAASLKGRFSSRIRGWFTPDAVLRMLIDRTGLNVQYTAPDAFVLEPDAAVSAPLPRDREFDTLLQRHVRNTFCGNAQIQPGEYRAAFRLQINSGGRVEDARLLGTSGNAERDKAIVASLSGLELERGPADPSQAFVMLVLPQDECGTSIGSEP